MCGDVEGKIFIKPKVVLFPMNRSFVELINNTNPKSEFLSQKRFLRIKGNSEGISVEMPVSFAKLCKDRDLFTVFSFSSHFCRQHMQGSQKTTNTIF